MPLTVNRMNKAELRAEVGSLRRRLGAIEAGKERGLRAVPQSDRWKLEATLLETEARYRALFECPLIGIYLFDLDTRIIDVNPAACELVGFDLDELKTRRLETLVATPDDQLLAAQAIREILEQGELKNPVTLRLRRKNGEVIWVETVANLVRENGEAVAIEGTLRNITEKRQLMASLRESERRFRETVENVHLVGIGLDVTGKISFCNDHLLQLTGREGEQVVGRDWFDLFIPPENLRAVRSMFTETIRGGTFPFHHENPIVTRSGDRLQIAWSNTVLKDGEGSIIGTVSLGEDVTRQRAAEEELRKSANLMQTVFASLGDAVLIIDPPTHHILQCNHAVERVFGYSCVELTGQMTGMLFADDHDYAEFCARCGEALKIGRIAHIEFRQRQKNGSIVETETTVSAIDEEAGWQAGVIWVVRDVSERRKAQRQQEAGEREQRRLVGKLQEERERLVQAQSIGKIGSWEEDSASGRIWASAETFRILGLSQAEAEIEGDRVAACFPHRVRFDRFMASLRAGGRLQELELTVNPADGGESRVVRVTGELRRFREGQPSKLVGVIHDVTKRKDAEKSLIRSQFQLRALTSRLENLREEERTRISREIHDELGQMLTAIKMDLRWMEQFLDPLNDDHRLNPMLDRLIETGELADATIGTVQRIAADLRPGILDKLGLGNALVYEAALFEERSGIVCTVEMAEEDSSTDPEIATSCFRIFQEALTNAARHANATRIEVVLSSEGDWTNLKVRDNGRGISGAELVDPASLGLLGMQERARLLGGEVLFASGPGSGTEVTVRIPCRPNSREGS